MICLNEWVELKLNFGMVDINNEFWFGKSINVVWFTLEHLVGLVLCLVPDEEIV